MRRVWTDSAGISGLPDDRSLSDCPKKRQSPETCLAIRHLFQTYHYPRIQIIAAAVQPSVESTNSRPSLRPPGTPLMSRHWLASTVAAFVLALSSGFAAAEDETPAPPAPPAEAKPA